jgi:membrane associated rhomboid family serine protease
MRVAWPPVTPGVKILLGVFTALFLISLFRYSVGFDEFLGKTFNLSVNGLLGHFYLWQPITYQFFHDDFFHLLFNGIVLWSFGGEVERRWNTRAFLGFVLICGVGGAVFIVVSQLVFPGTQLSPGGWSTTETLGASGGIMGVVTAYCIYNWNRRLRLLFIPFALQAKHILFMFIGLDILFVLMGSNISMAGHMGGMAAGALLVTGWYKPGRVMSEYRLRKARRRLRLLQGGHPLDIDAEKRKKNGDSRYLH